MELTDTDRLTDEQSPIAERVSVAARSWARPDALEHRQPEAELELLLDVLNELNSRRLRIAELEAGVQMALKKARGRAEWPEFVALRKLVQEK